MGRAGAGFQLSAGHALQAWTTYSSRFGCDKVKRLAFGLALALLGSVSGAGEPYEVKGEISYVDYLQNTNRHYLTVSFTIAVDSPKWFIHGESQNGYDYQEASYDGENLYYLANFASDIEKQRAGGKRMADNIGTCWAFKGEILHTELAHKFTPIWLAYASGAYFQSRSNALVEPAITYGVSSWEYEYSDRFKQRGVWTLQSDWPHLPSEVIYFEDGMRRVRGYPQLARPCQAPYDNGYTNAIYQVLRFTNVNGLVLPALARLDTYVPMDKGTSSNDLKHISTYEISLHSVRSTGFTASFKPAMAGVFSVSDLRFSQIGPLMYKTKKWLSEKEVMTIPEYRYKVNRYEMTRGTRVFIVSLLTLLFVSPLFFIVQHLRKQQPRNQRSSL